MKSDEGGKPITLIPTVLVPTRLRCGRKRDETFPFDHRWGSRRDPNLNGSLAGLPGGRTFLIPVRALKGGQDGCVDDRSGTLGSRVEVPQCRWTDDVNSHTYLASRARGRTGQRKVRLDPGEGVCRRGREVTPSRWTAPGVAGRRSDRTLVAKGGWGGTSVWGGTRVPEGPK